MLPTMRAIDKLVQKERLRHFFQNRYSSSSQWAHQAMAGDFARIPHKSSPRQSGEKLPLMTNLSVVTSAVRQEVGPEERILV